MEMVAAGPDHLPGLLQKHGPNAGRGAGIVIGHHLVVIGLFFYFPAEKPLLSAGSTVHSRICTGDLISR